MAQREIESDEENVLTSKRFRKSISAKEEAEKLCNAVPLSTRYKNKWAVKVFEDWKRERVNKSPKSEETCLDVDLESVENLDSDWEKMSPNSLDFWIGKFLQDVTDKNGKPYPGPSLYQIVAGLKRHLETKHRRDVNMLDKNNSCFSGLRKILDSEMKEVHAQGITNKKKEKKPFTDEEEERMWKEGVLGLKSAKTLMHTVYYYNGILFGLRAGEHRLLRLRDIEVESECIIYRENSSKTFHGGINDLKKKARVIKHICHKKGEDHDRCLVHIYKRYFELVNSLRCKDKAFYFQPYEDRFLYKNAVVGIHSLDKIVPSLCDAIGVERRTSHCLRVTCASKLFNAHVDEKLIRERTGHTSNALFVYEKASKEKEEMVSSVLGPVHLNKKDDSDVKNEINVNSKSEFEFSSITDLSNNEMPEFDFADFNFLGDGNLDTNVVRETNVQSIPIGWNYCSDGLVNYISGNCNVTINQFRG